MLSGGDGPSKLPLHKFPLIPCSSPRFDQPPSTRSFSTKNQQVAASGRHAGTSPWFPDEILLVNSFCSELHFHNSSSFFPPPLPFTPLSLSPLFFLLFLSSLIFLSRKAGNLALFSFRFVSSGFESGSRGFSSYEICWKLVSCCIIIGRFSYFFKIIITILLLLLYIFIIIILGIIIYYYCRNLV